MKFKILPILDMEHFVRRLFYNRFRESEEKTEQFPAEIILPYHGPFSPPQLRGTL